eukprot:sb/3478878/
MIIEVSGSSEDTLGPETTLPPSPEQTPPNVTTALGDRIYALMWSCPIGSGDLPILTQNAQLLNSTRKRTRTPKEANKIAQNTEKRVIPIGQMRVLTT